MNIVHTREQTKAVKEAMFYGGVSFAVPDITHVTKSCGNSGSKIYW